METAGFAVQLLSILVLAFCIPVILIDLIYLLLSYTDEEEEK